MEKLHNNPLHVQEACELDIERLLAVRYVKKKKDEHVLGEHSKKVEEDVQTMKIH